MADEMAESYTLVSLKGRRCGYAIQYLPQRGWKCQKDPESVLLVDVTLQLPCTGRYFLRHDISHLIDVHGAAVYKLTCDGLWFDAQHDWHGALGLFQLQ